MVKGTSPASLPLASCKIQLVEGEQEVAGWEDGEAGVFISLPHPQPKQALWGYESAVAPFLHLRLQQLLSHRLFNYNSLQVLRNSSPSVPSSFGQGWQSLSPPPALQCFRFCLLFLFTLTPPLRETVPS